MTCSVFVLFFSFGVFLMKTLMSVSQTHAAMGAHVLTGWLPSHVCVYPATLDCTVRRVSYSKESLNMFFINVLCLIQSVATLCPFTLPRLKHSYGMIYSLMRHIMQVLILIKPENKKLF